MDTIGKETIDRFACEGYLVDVAPYGHGHINATYLVTTSAKRYILQRINTAVFPDVDSLMCNIRLVTAFVNAEVASRGGLPGRDALRLVPTKDGDSYCRTPSGFFRMYDFIEDAVSLQIADHPDHMREAGKAFGGFARLLEGLDPKRLSETVPGFHFTPGRFAAFREAVEADPLGRAKEVAREIEFLLERQRYCTALTDPLSLGAIPVRVAHNDTKLNNVLFDSGSGQALAVIDLDTVMPGSILCDFGDAIRSGCNAAEEDETDLERVRFRFDLYCAFAEGYLQAFGTITAAERELLALSALVMTYECGLRFLADHLVGDVYFKIARPGHNLDRARTQCKLLADMEREFDRMRQTVAAL